jgi:hypothetical protein
MSGGVIIEFSREPLWERSMAIHEAGHAVAAWLNGAVNIEISLADEFRIAKGSSGKISDDCRAVCFHDTYSARTYILVGMTILFAGVMAEHLYSEEDPKILLGKSGRGDAADIQKLLDEHRQSGATEDECQALYGRAYSLSLELVKRYWWEIIALAKLTENFNYIPYNKIRSLLGMFPSMNQGFNILKELEA